MQPKKKKTLYVMFLLITVLMFLHSWKVYVTPTTQASNYAHKHFKQPLHHPIKHHSAPHSVQHYVHIQSDEQGLPLLL